MTAIGAGLGIGPCVAPCGPSKIKQSRSRHRLSPATRPPFPTPTMPSLFPLDPDDPADHLLAGEAPATVPCRRCGRPLARWRTVCPSCGAAQGRTRGPVRAIPVAPPADTDLPFAEAVDEADGIPIAALVDDPEDIPIAPVVRRRRRRPRRPPSQAWRLIPMFIGYAIMMVITIAFAVAVVFAAVNQ